MLPRFAANTIDVMLQTFNSNESTESPVCAVSSIQQLSHRDEWNPISTYWYFLFVSCAAFLLVALVMWRDRG